MNKAARRSCRAVEDAGGSWRETADGHIAFYDGAGRYIHKMRPNGAGDPKIHDRVMRQVLRRIVRARDQD